MPGNVTSASPSLVLPRSLCSSFAEVLEFSANMSVYKSAEYQAGLNVDNPRRAWKMARRLQPSASDALLAFYLLVGGAASPFWFYDPFAGSPIGSNWDASGALTTGRFAARFEGQLTVTAPKPGRLQSDFLIREIA